MIKEIDNLTSNGKVIAGCSEDGWVLTYNSVDGDSLEKNLFKKKPNHSQPVSFVLFSILYLRHAVSKYNDEYSVY